MTSEFSNLKSQILNPPGLSRREMLLSSGCGFGGLALAHLLPNHVLSSPAPSPQPLAPKTPHVPPRAKSVIFLFMEGGPSHLDTFDYKPLLNQLAGQQLPPSFKAPITAMGESKAPLLASKRTWKQRGRSGLWVSDWFDKMGEHADDL